MMDIAVFSDIHGNHVAFRACLDYVLSHDITTFIFLGDYLGEFAYPQKTMEMIYELKEKYNCYFIRGNKEDYWINCKYDNNCEWKDGNLTVGAMLYCYANQTEEDRDFFEGLPHCKEIVFEGAGPLLACHGSPNRNNEKMLPDDERTRQIMEKCEQKYILCGHTHLQGIIRWGDKMAINPGAVGVALHGGGKAQFLILHQKGQEWEPEFISIDYDKEKVTAELDMSGLTEEAPYWTAVTKHLILTGEVAHGSVLVRAMCLCEEETGSSNWYDVPDKYWKQAIAEMLGEA